MYLSNNTHLQGGKYKIIRFLSSGGFGNTYEGVHMMLDTHVAIKEFFPKMFCDRDEKNFQVTVATQGNIELVEKLRAKFKKEAQAVFNMKHKNIVRVLDIFEENNTAYYVMEYIDGKSLNDITKERGSLPEAEAVRYIRQVADALKYVHSLNRLHLDIKPGNIMVDKNGKAILIDFGASKHYDTESGENTSTLMGLNTKGYAPIEQSTQSFSSFSPATDIYALGATLYKLLTGIVPPDSNLLMAEEETLAPLSSNVSDGTRAAVEAAMRLRRKDRPQTIEDFLYILDDKTKQTNNPKKIANKEINQNEEQTLFDSHDSIEVKSNKEISATSSNKKDGLYSLNEQTKYYSSSTQAKRTSKSKWIVALFLAVISILGFGIYKCSESGTVTLNSRADSLSYAVGVLQANGLREYLAKNLNVDTINCMNDFEEGVKFGIESDSSEINALYAGYQFGEQLCGTIQDEINKDLFNDPSKSLDLHAFVKGLKDAILSPENTLSPKEAAKSIDGIRNSDVIDNAESLSYNLGVVGSPNIKELYLDEMRVENSSFGSFFEHLDEYITKKDDSNFRAYTAGLTISQQLPEILSGISRELFKEKESLFWVDAFLAGFMDVAMNRKLQISYENAITIVNNSNDYLSEDAVNTENLKSCVDGLEIPDGAVDLGLSVYWGSTNIGTTKAHGYGNLYAWGDPTGKKRYIDCSKGFPPKNICGNKRYDYAAAKLGGYWRLPSEAEVNELITKCKWEWEVIQGVKCAKVTGPNGNVIHLPLCGIRYNHGTSQQNDVAEYWTGTLGEESTHGGFGSPDGMTEGDYVSAKALGFVYMTRYNEELDVDPKVEITMGCGAAIRPVYGRTK